MNPDVEKMLEEFVEKLMRLRGWWASERVHRLRRKRRRQRRRRR